jgi:hypothetical protein
MPRTGWTLPCRVSAETSCAIVSGVSATSDPAAVRRGWLGSWICQNGVCSSQCASRARWPRISTPGAEGGRRRVRTRSRSAAGPRTATSALPWPCRTVMPDGVRVISHSPVPGNSGSVAWKCRLCPSPRSSRAGPAEPAAIRPSHSSTPSAARPAARSTSRPAARPEAGRAHSGHGPHQVAARVRDGLDDQVRARVQPGSVPRRVLRQLPVCYLAHRHGRGRAGRHDLSRPPVAAAEVGGQLPECPSRAGRDQPVQVTVDDPGQFRRAGAQPGREAVVLGRTHQRPPHSGTAQHKYNPGNAPYPRAGCGAGAN